MNTETHAQLAAFIWDICNLLRGPYKRNEYRKVILPLTVLRRFDCILAPTKQAVLAVHRANLGKSETLRQRLLQQAAGLGFYNTSRLDFPRLLDDPNQLAPNLTAYIDAFSPNVRTIMERFGFEQQIAKMAEKNILFKVIKAFCDPRLDLSTQRVDHMQMGYCFEELIRIGAEQANEEAGEHFTPREVIKLMVNLLLSPERDLARANVVKTIYDPACGTGGMLSEAEKYIRQLNAEAQPHLHGQDWNDEAWAVCKSDMLIKGEEAENIKRGDSFLEDYFDRDPQGRRWTFDYMLANPPFGVTWKQQEEFIVKERDSLGFHGRFGAGTPRVNDGALLFLQHMLAKQRDPEDGGTRIAIVFNGSPLFTGDAEGGESNIRRWIIENDWLEAVVALPDQLFYNTGIATYIWVLTNRKELHRQGKVQLIDARRYSVKMKKSLGNKRNKIGDPGEPGEPDHIGEITRIHGDFRHDDSRVFSIDGRDKRLTVSKVLANADLGYQKITVERPLRLNFQASEARIARLDLQSGFRSLATPRKKGEDARRAEIHEGRGRQNALRDFCCILGEQTHEHLFMDRAEFQAAISATVRATGLKLSLPERKLILAALSERDEQAAICTDAQGNPEPDPELRDTEIVPLTEAIQTYFEREVLPHVPDAWIDFDKTRIGYEIPLNRHFYRYEPPRPLPEIEGDIKRLEQEILTLLSEVTA